ncbi:MAG: GGDEF domain-containing protein [Acidobacteriota bacterium]
MVAAIALLGYRTGWQLRFSFLFLIPIALLSWFAGNWSGLAISAISALAWLVAARESGHTFSRDAILYSNSLLLLGVFLVFGSLLSALRRAHTREQLLARTDSLTGIPNHHAFFENARLELSRAARYQRPLTIAYIDLDDFKAVNDRNGHEGGDRLLALTAATIQNAIRATDLVARLGGDEFCVLLPEAGPAEATATLRKLEAQLKAALVRERWDATFSMGAVVFRAPPESPEEMVRLADGLMYSIKARGKGRLEVQVFGE